MSNLTQYKEILPNARFVDYKDHELVMDCTLAIDKKGNVIGYIQDGFVLNEKYEHGQQVYERFLENGVLINRFYNF